jgi:hypothetical protein
MNISQFERHRSLVSQIERQTTDGEKSPEGWEAKKNMSRSIKVILFLWVECW